MPCASRTHQDPTSTFTKIYRRSLCVLQAWVEDCYTVDFIRNAGLLEQLEDFISSKVKAALANLVSLLGSGRKKHHCLVSGNNSDTSCFCPRSYP